MGRVTLAIPIGFSVSAPGETYARSCGHCPLSLSTGRDQQW